MSYSWTQPACDTCFAGTFPNVANPVRVLGETETCCMCGCQTRSGLYVRLNPSTVPHPTEET
jgi:hypothetical protein